MADQRRFGIEEREGVYAKECRAESKDNLVTSQCTGNWTWRSVEDNRIDY